nr:uncharacterized protein LOC126054983 [Helicoverpa armigera]
MGAVPTLHNTNYTTSCCSVLQENNINSLLKLFWELEEVSAPPSLSRKDLECEEHFRATTVRDDSGRYVVALPFCGDPYSLGDSYAAALRRFYCLERKLDASLKLRGAYNDVMRDYINKGFLSPVVIDEGNNSLPAYYIPHHGVIREDKTSTKLRVVLDASCRTTSGQSINDILHAGPDLQGDLFNILIKFRLFKIALSADCRQMFLNIGVCESDRKFQRILYRFDNSEPLSVYQFNRVCFGLKSSPYHALRVVRQLIADEGDNFPAAAAAAASALYMDDIVYSVPSAPQAVSLCEELIQLFKRGQFDLVKWTSNSKEVLAHIPDSHKASPDIEFEKSIPHKVLGLRWDRHCDNFRFDISSPDGKCTKRIMLSTVARLWDIMGFVAPTILYAKLLIKDLWLAKCEWDDTPPDHIVAAWKQFCVELSALNQITVPRHLGLVDGCTINLIGFADASERAYGGVIYLQVRIGSNYSVQLVCAKSKVSPVKTISVARLELCAALLLSRLLRKVQDTIASRYSINKVYAFTDSKVVLAWINSSPHRWQTFVANRVTKIIELIPAACFHHVAGIENPADCLSRGVTPANLPHHPLWYHGPSWISRDPSEWPIQPSHNAEIEDIPERKSVSHPVTIEVPVSPIYALALRMSSWSKLLRVIVYVCKFIKKLPRGTCVSSSDLEVAEYTLLRALQAVHFSKDVHNLRNNTPCSPAVLKLKPFLDEHGILRVGGRLSNSDVPYNYKHPCILPRHDHVVNLLVDFYHKKHLHAGPELLMSLLRQNYWILAARRIIRHIIHKCNTCFKYRPRPVFPPMADLPTQRVNQVNKAFTHTGCDYAGPLQYTPVRGRGVKSRKAWLCIFTCLTTRATHIEVATDLSTVSFLAALKRFLSRRGPIQCLYTDNGTCFVGASSYLRDLYKFLNKEYSSRLQQELSINRIDWKFIPPASPHFGGCWESMVKVIKTHLFRVIGQQILSYEELLTILAQIEALVNSRPLTALSSDPAEPSALTPAHFLNTVPLSSLPAPEADSSSLLQRHTLLDKLVQSFWRRWRSEYLHQLQARSKWNSPASPIQEGTLVIIINENSAPLSWPLGIIEKLHTSKDGTTRVVTVKTAKGSYVRPVVRLCPLPTQ